MAGRQPFFRPQALARYAERREHTILPRLVAPPVFVCCWALLGLLLLAMLLVWQVQVPRSTVASGVLQSASPGQQRGANWMDALLFVPANPAPELHVGQAITLEVVLTGERFSGTMATVGSGVLRPEEARQRYALTGDLALLITQPSVVVQVAVGPTLPVDAVEGLSISAQVPVGATSLLALLPHLLSGLLGG
jgi:hypothetical protein